MRIIFHSRQESRTPGAGVPGGNEVEATGIGPVAAGLQNALATLDMRPRDQEKALPDLSEIDGVFKTRACT